MAARLFEHGMKRVESRADGQTFIAGRRLNVSAAKWGLVKDLSVGHAIERTSAGHHQIVERNASVQIVQHVEENFFKAMLQGECQIHIALRDLCMLTARCAE